MESSHWSSPGHMTRMRGSHWLMRWGQMAPAGFYPSLPWWYNCWQKMWAMWRYVSHTFTLLPHHSNNIYYHEVMWGYFYHLQGQWRTSMLELCRVGGTETEFILVNVSPWIPTTNNSRSQKLTLIQSIQIIKMKARGYFVGWNLSTIKSLV